MRVIIVSLAGLVNLDLSTRPEATGLGRQTLGRLTWLLTAMLWLTWQSACHAGIYTDVQK